MSSSTNNAARRAHVQAALTAFANTPLHKALASLMYRAVATITVQFERMNTGKQVKSTGDFELITWLVIKQSEGNTQ